MPPIKIPYSPQVGQIGSQLDTTFFLFDNCIQNRENIPTEEFERMLETDETVQIGLQFLVLSVLMKLGKYKHKNPKIKDFVNDNFELMQGNIFTVCEEILTGLWAGYSGSEIVWKSSGNRVVLDKIVTYHPQTVLIKVDRETGAYAGIKQWRWFAGSPVDIPAQKCILYTYNKRFGNYYGKSILKPIRKNWLLKDPILKMWGRALDRFGTPLLAVFTTDDEINDPDNPGEKINQLKYAVRLIERIQSGTGLAFTAGSKDDGTASRAEVLTAGAAGVGQAFESALIYLNKMLLRGMLVPSLIFDNLGSGSYALGKTHFETYDMTISSIYASLAETLLEQLVEPLVNYNFGPQQDYGKFMERKLAQEDRNLLADCFLKMVNAGFLSAQNQEDMNCVREALNLPERDVTSFTRKF